MTECHAPWVTGPTSCQPARAAAHEDNGCLATELVEAISAQVLSASPMATVAVGVWESVSIYSWLVDVTMHGNIKQPVIIGPSYSSVLSS